MAISQLRSRRNVTGSRYVNSRKKRKYELGRTPVLTKLGKKVLKQVRTPGNNKKVKLLNEEFISLIGKDKKATKIKITAVVENPANRHYVRRNILTKGTIVETEKGKARITSRPGQTGSLSGVLV